MKKNKTKKILLYIGIIISLIILIDKLAFLIMVNVFDFKSPTYKNTDTIICKIKDEEYKFIITYNHLHRINEIFSTGSIHYEDVVGKNVLGNNVKDIEESIIEFFDKEDGQCNITTKGPVEK